MKRKSSLLAPTMLWFVLIICGEFGGLVAGGNILFLLPMSSKSHKNVFQPLMTEMAARGHNIVVISPYKPTKEEPGIRELVPTDFAAKMAAYGSDPIKTRAEGNLGQWIVNYDFLYEFCKQVYEDPEVMALLHQKFDLIYVNAFINDCMYGLVHKLRAPFIIVSSAAAPATITKHVGLHQPSSFVPSMMFDFSDSMTFLQRLANLAFNVIYEAHNDLSYLPGSEAVYKKCLGQDMPNIGDILRNASAIFMNTHFALTHPRPTLPGVFEVGGLHCRPSRQLPKDILDFVSGAGPDGFIYFSLGSIIQASTMPEYARKIFLNVFSRLKQRVLWKWETETMPDLPANVKLTKWAPQQDILGHPNLKMFITHSGLLSTIEATYHGVPLIGIPFFGDQDLNIANAERAGYALGIEILEITEDSFEKTIRRILTEPKFTNRAKELSSLFRDQIETPLERAVYWSEYVMRHKGAKHMWSAARNLNFFQYHSLDVIAVLALIVFGCLWVVKIIVLVIFCKICRRRKVTTGDTKMKQQ